MVPMMTPVLLLTGPVGVGKTTLARDATDLLLAAKIPHATVALEEIAGCWPRHREQPAERRQHVFRNLALLWSAYAEWGAERLIVDMLVEDRSDVAAVAGAIPAARVTTVRLRAPLPLIESRIRHREPYQDLREQEVAAAQWWVPRAEELAIGDVVVENGDRDPREVAVEILRLAGWLNAGRGVNK
jgi:predicted kinase